MNEKQLHGKCCHCGDVRTAHGWKPEPQQGGGLRIYTHTYCPTCLDRILPAVGGVELEATVSAAG